MGERTYIPSEPGLAKRAEYQRTAYVGPVKPSPSACGGEAAASSNLDKSPLEDQHFCGPSYRVTLADFGDGVVEVRAVFQEAAWKGGKRVRKERRPNEAVVAERRAQHVRRSKRTVKERALMLRVDRMLTLTKRGKFHDRDSAWVAWKAFCKLCRRFYGKMFPFIAVIEPHLEGGFHLHVAISGYRDVGILRRFWYRALGGKGHETREETPGSINVRWGVSGAIARTRIARYIAKYIGKQSSEVVGGRRSFASSVAIPKPELTRWYQPVESGSDGIATAHRWLRRLIDPSRRDRTGRFVALTHWRYSFGGVHGFVISPI